MRFLSCLSLLFVGSVCFAQSSAEAEARQVLSGEFFEPTLIRIATEKERLVPGVIACLKDKDPKIKLRAAEALEFIDMWQTTPWRRPSEGLGEKRLQAVAGLADAAKDENLAVKNQAVRSLVVILRERSFSQSGPNGNPITARPISEIGSDAIPALLVLLKESLGDRIDQMGIEVTALRAIRQIGDSSAIDAVIEYGRNAEGFMASQAIRCLVSFPEPKSVTGVISLLGSYHLSHSYTDHIWMSKKFSQMAYPEFARQLLSNPDPKIRSSIANIFETNPHSSITFSLQRALQDENDEVRTNAAEALVENPHPNNGHLFLKLLEDPNPNVQVAAIKGLSKTNHPYRYQAILQLTGNPGKFAAISALKSLSQIDDNRALKDLVLFLKNTRLRPVALEELSLLDPKLTAPFVIELLESESRVDRIVAARIVGKAAVLEAIPKLLSMAKSEDEYEHEASVEALGDIGLAVFEALADLTSSWKNGSRDDLLTAIARTKDPRAFDLISKYLNSDDRINAINALRHLGDLRSVPLLIPFLGSSEDGVFESAVMALANLKAKQAVPHLLSILKGNPINWNSVHIIAALGEIGDSSAVPMLHSILDSPEQGITHNVIVALGEIGDPRSVKPLAKFLDSEDRYCGMAAKALGKIGHSAALPYLKSLLESDRIDLAREAKKYIEQATKGSKSSPG